MSARLGCRLIPVLAVCSWSNDYIWMIIVPVGSVIFMVVFNMLRHPAVRHACGCPIGGQGKLVTKNLSRKTTCVYTSDIKHQILSLYSWSVTQVRLVITMASPTTNIANYSSWCIKASGFLYSWSVFLQWSFYTGSTLYPHNIQPLPITPWSLHGPTDVLYSTRSPTVVQLQHTGLLQVEISTEVFICCSGKMQLQWKFQQPMMVELYFNFLNTLPLSNEYL